MSSVRKRDEARIQEYVLAFERTFDVMVESLFENRIRKGEISEKVESDIRNEEMVNLSCTEKTLVHEIISV